MKKTKNGNGSELGRLIQGLEVLMKKWGVKVKELDEQVARLESVKDMIGDEAVNPPIQWRVMQSTALTTCISQVSSEVSSYNHKISMDALEKTHMELELKSQGRESEIDQPEVS